MLKNQMFKTCFTLASIIFVLDQLTKVVLIATMGHKRIAVMPHVNFVLAYNKGAAFGFLATAGGWQRWMFITVALIITLAIYFWSKRLHKKDFVENIGLGLILGGAWGNLLDRIRLGHVVDFIDFYIGNWHWYTFNIADMGICIGAFLLCLIMVIKR